MLRIGSRAFALRHASRSSRPFSAAALKANVASSSESKYAEKLKRKMEEKGVGSLDELKAKTPPPVVEPVGVPKRKDFGVSTGTGKSASSSTTKPTFTSPERKDSSPVKPLSSFLDISRIMATPHTAEQISSLWLVYHASRSNGTGRGFLSASMSRTQYTSMLERARKYPLFILPLPRTIPADPTAEDPKLRVDNQGTEMYFMQWDTHERPEVPSARDPTSLDALLSSSSSPPPPTPSSTEIPPAAATIILTPLQEYKLHGTFAAPRLVLTFYPNFAHTHDLVLLRGEISTSDSGAANYLLSQIDAQLLATGVQRFYLPPVEGVQAEVKQKADEAFALLRSFHETPEKFDYAQLVQTVAIL